MQHVNYKIIAAIVVSLISVTASGKPPDITPLATFMITEVQNSSIVSVRGTWTIPDARTPGERIADPINAVHIWCQKSTHECFEAFARVQDGDFLSAELIPYDVTSWRKQEITAETSGLCAISTLTINLVTQEVYRITRNGGASPNGCKSMSTWKPLKKPTIEKLVSGLDATKGVK
jgi:hypothetical protein